MHSAKFVGIYMYYNALWSQMLHCIYVYTWLGPQCMDYAYNYVI